MIRLLFRTASSSGLSIPSKFLSGRGFCAHKFFFSSIAPASETSSSLPKPASETLHSRRKTLVLEAALPTRRWRFSCLKLFADFSPSYRFSACRSLRLGFTAHDLLQKNALAEENLSNLPVRKDISSLKRQSPLQSNGRLAQSFRVWLGAATAAAVLLFSAIAFYKQDEDQDEDCTNKSTFALATAKVQHSAMEIWTKVNVLYDNFCTRFSTFLAKSSEAATAIAVLVRCVNAVLFTKGEDYANELALRWKLRVISLLADLAGSSHSRRRALIQAGNGSVVDWLLEAVRHGELEYRVIQAEAARALSHFLSDDVTCDVVLGRRNALSQLLLFAASIQPNMNTKNLKLKRLPLFLENEESTRGRSMLVAALMDIITSSCETEKKGVIRPKLSGLADAKDISAALKVLQEGRLSLDDESGDGDDGEDGQGMNKVLGIGMTVSGETSIVAVQDQSLHNMLGPLWNFLSNQGGTGVFSGKGWQAKLTTDLVAPGSTNFEEIVVETKQGTASHGLWDDLHGSHVAVPLAAWAIATWAQASSANCTKIARLDKDGDAILACVLAPERTVKWHGAIAARLVLENGFDEPAVSWSGALLETASQASKAEDAQLSLVSLDSFYTCVKKSSHAREIAAKNSVVILRDIAKQTSQIVSLQNVIAEIFEILCFRSTGVSIEEGKKWSSILLYWLFNHALQNSTRLIASRVLAHVLNELGPNGIPLSQAWLAMLIQGCVNGVETNPTRGDVSASNSKSKGLVQGRASQQAIQAANELAKVVWLSLGEAQGPIYEKGVLDGSESDWGDLTKLDLFKVVGKGSRKDKGKPTAAKAAESTLKALKALTELSVEDKGCQLRMIEAGSLQLLRRFTLNDDFDRVFVPQRESITMTGPDQEKVDANQQTNVENGFVSNLKGPPGAQLRKHAARLLSILSLQPAARTFLKEDEAWCRWLEGCANNQISSCKELKTCSYARATVLNIASNTQKKGLGIEQQYPHYEDKVFIINTDSPFWRWDDLANEVGSTVGSNVTVQESKNSSDFEMDVVFVHGLRGGPFKTWRIAEDKTSSTDKAGLVEKIDVDSGRVGTCWPKEWLSSDIPACRLLTVKYKTNLSQWSGASLPLQEVSAMLLQKLFAAGVGERPVVFITHSMGGLVVKQMLMHAGQDTKYSQIVKNTSGIVFYSCPHFGSKLADMPWRLGLVLRPAPSIGELRSGSVRLEELNQFIRTLHKGGLEILSFSETKVTPLVEGYGGWALRMEVVPIESAYPGFGELVVLDGTDHVNACKPLNRDDIAYTHTLQLLQKLSKSVKRSHS